MQNNKKKVNNAIVAVKYLFLSLIITSPKALCLNYETINYFHKSSHKTQLLKWVLLISFVIFRNYLRGQIDSGQRGYMSITAE